jgi:hypothetical protein
MMKQNLSISADFLKLIALAGVLLVGLGADSLVTDQPVSWDYVPGHVVPSGIDQFGYIHAQIVPFGPTFLVYVPTYVDGKGPYWLELDTGCQITLLSSAVFSPPPFAYVQTGCGFGGTKQVSDACVGSIQVGNSFQSQVEVWFGQVPPTFHQNFPVVGLLGANFLSHYKLTIDYPNQGVT